ncbi:MAG: hypothetical protein GY828_01565, partial [Candidatus Gracilibacteria bacterium]|nr:hypothetical protein [Candidatus Gracilibacteria bacterium]
MKKSREQIVEERDNSIEKLIQYAYSHTDYYRELFDSNKIIPNDIKSQNDLRYIPILTKQILAENSLKIKSSDKYSKKMVYVTSGGSSGHQVSLYKSQYFEQMSRAAWLLNNIIVDWWYPHEKSIWMWGSPIKNLKIMNSFKARLGLLVNKRKIFNGYSYNSNNFLLWIKD